MPSANPTCTAVHKLATAAKTLPRLMDASRRSLATDESNRLGTAIAGKNHKAASSATPNIVALGFGLENVDSEPATRTSSGHFAPASQALVAGRVNEARSQQVPPKTPSTSLAVKWTAPTSTRGVVMARGRASRSS